MGRPVPGDIEEHYARDDRPIHFRGKVGCLFTSEDAKGITHPAQVDGHHVNFVASSVSSCSVISERTLERIKRDAGSAFYEQYPYNLGYRMLNDQDDVEICDPYMGNLYNVIGKCKVPLKLPGDVNVVHDCFILRGVAECADMILGISDVMDSHGLGCVMSYSQEPRIKFHPLSS
ncbi:hypothetical protein DUNSADRAFT_10736 [Dunaliella salina]|uniref:Uncharacterized protein n=1 Tax=Dunaliella salina TaxID=3046 RepID=A0ABQ7GEN7_DUNSA|nr:hypothetical protein DUNSADRAFT_10736 [Dunaliella salina]|eukprot:KAF5833072.1 hypothetical protein DUNSADRAFT_10736 [Dunaliella salina]